MRNTKLIEILRTFTQKELTGFQDFVYSPYFNRNHEIRQLIDILYQYAPNFVNRNLEKKMVFQSLYGSKKFDEKKLGYLTSDAVKLAGYFLAINCWREKEFENIAMQSNEFNDRGLEKPFKSAMREAEKNLGNSKYRDSEYYYHAYLLALSANRHFDRQKKRTYDASIQQAADNLDIYYLINKLKFSCEIINRGNVVTTGYELKMTGEIARIIENGTYKNIPAVMIYYNVLNMLQKPDDESHYYDLKRILKKHAYLFPNDELRDMIAYAQNYCIKKVNTGKASYLGELLETYKLSIQMATLLIEGKMSPWTYKNIVSVGLRLEEFEWTEQFLEEHKEHLPDEYKEGAYAYNMANLNYHSGHYREALKLLQQVEFNDMYYFLDTKATMLKIYYEWEDYSLYALMESMRAYLKRNRKVSAYMKNAYKNLIKYTDSLFKLENGDIDKLNKLQERIENTRELANSSWLLEKVQEKL